MTKSGWKQRLQEWRGEPIEANLTRYQATLAEISLYSARFSAATDDELKAQFNAIRARARSSASAHPSSPHPSLPPTSSTAARTSPTPAASSTPTGASLAARKIDDLKIEVFALVREAAQRTLSMRPFDVQIIAALALHEGKLVEMQTGEGKTLVAVLPAILNALTGNGVHILTFNDYLARRDALWMGPVYNFLGLSVAFIQEGMSIAERRDAYRADITYATAKEAGFDFLRSHLARKVEDIVHRESEGIVHGQSAQSRFNYAIIDEADSILIDEARSPLVIAGDRIGSETSPYRIAELIAQLDPNTHWETDQHQRNIFLTEAGIETLEKAFARGDLHAPENLILLTEINQALHARALLRKDIDYIVRDGKIEVVDEFTGRVVEDRRWPDGLQAALEAKEALAIQPGGRVLGSITLPHYLQNYAKLAGMTATAQTSAEEFANFYNLVVVPIPPNVPCIREDAPDQIFTHRQAKDAALLREIKQVHATRRPILVGTSTIEESEALAELLDKNGVACRVLNAKNDEAEAEIVASAGALDAVTISTNMAGRGTDIKLGGADQVDHEAVLELGGLYVIGTNRHESRRIDNQLRGRAGRQGDPGSSRFFVSLEDTLMVRFGIERLIPEKVRPSHQNTPIENPIILSEVERLQRIVDGQNYEIRKTLARYAAPIEEQRRRIHDWRKGVLSGDETVELCSKGAAVRYQELSRNLDGEAVERIERAITLHHIDEAWAEHLYFLAQLREGIHLEALRRKDPLLEFHKQAAENFWKLQETIDQRIVDSFNQVIITNAQPEFPGVQIEGPASTWTYLINDRAFSQMQQMLFGPAGTAFAVTAVMTTWPLIAGWAIWKRFSRRGK